MYEARPVVGYEDRYIVTTLGDIFSIKRTIYSHGKNVVTNKQYKLKPSKDKKGYLIVNLFDEKGKHKSMKVHRLVAMAFIPNPYGKRCVCHKDNNPGNNSIDNLYWGTDKENQKQAWDDGLHKNTQPVTQLDKNGTKIAEFNSQSEASKMTGVPQANIWKCLVGERKTAGGYIWQRSD